MSRVIFKYPITEDNNKLKLTRPAEILSAIIQDGNIVIYALVDKDEIRGTIFDFKILGTGHPANMITLSEYNFLSTLKDGSYVWHIFYKKEEEINEEE